MANKTTKTNKIEEHQYLIEWNMVYPWDRLTVYDLDILKQEFAVNVETKGISFEVIRDNVEIANKIYINACKRSKQDIGEIVEYNDSLWGEIAASDALSAVKEFENKIKDSKWKK